MRQIAFVFPGQGAQYPGMGKELAARFPLVEEYFQRADAALGWPLSRLCFEGPAAELTLTENAQPAAGAGLSLGEYSALVVSGMLDFEDAVRLVARRGKYMQEAVPAGVGSMAAIFGLSDDQVEELCRQTPGIVEPANYNSPGQIAVSGEKQAVADFCTAARAAGARRALELQVSAPFHCSLLQPAAEKLAADLASVEFRPPQIPVLANVDTEPISLERVRDLLARQVASPVLWQQCVARLAGMGIGTLIELGPGKVLCGLARKTVPALALHNVETPADLEKLKEAIAGWN